jgi:nicotinamide riboside transporter PnuC
MKDFAGYLAMVSGIIAAVMVSANFGRKVTGYGFAVFAASSLVWVAFGVMKGELPLIVQNGVLFVINLLGIYRWLIMKERGPQAPGAGE